MNDLLQECRISGYFSISEIEYAVMEVDGEISFLPTVTDKQLTPKDINLNLTQEELLSNVIIDGKIMKDNLSNMKKSIKWLLKELKVKGYSLDSIILATLDNKENLVIYKKNVNNNNLQILE